MRTSPSSSSTSSTSITLEPSLSGIGFLVFAVPGRSPRWEKRRLGAWGAQLVLTVGVPCRRALCARALRFRALWTLGLGGHRQGEQKARTVGVGRVQPDPAAKVLDDFPGHGQADAGAWVGGPFVQALEDDEDPVGVVRLDSDAVVGEREQPEIPVRADRD